VGGTAVQTAVLLVVWGNLGGCLTTVSSQIFSNAFFMPCSKPIPLEY
jgi:hypothetical protein